MYVFGIDIPLVEMLFVICILLIILFIMLFFVTINIASMNRKLTMTIVAEDKELEDLRTMRKEIRDTKKDEMKELDLLRQIREELKKLLSEEKQEIGMLEKFRKMENGIKEKYKDKRENIEKNWVMCPKCKIPMVAYFKYNRKTGEYNKNLGALYICPKCDYHVLRKLDEKLFQGRNPPLSEEIRPDWMKEDMKTRSNSIKIPEKKQGM